MSIDTGQIIADRYRIEAFLGKGGMAEVYKVTDMERSAYLALKMLREELAEDVVFLRRFKHEAQALARLQHPYIVRFYGLEQNERQAFILMDFIEGTTLRKEIFRLQTPFHLGKIVEIARAVCSALSFAHNQGLVHCDIKPANIMLHRNGKVLLADFGIARMTESATSTSLSGAGTPAYMAPEQVRGEVPTPQTDIYSFGVVLYEMATGGDRPFTGEHAGKTGSTIEKVQWEQLFLDPLPPSQYNKQIVPELESVILKCLQKDPKTRQQTALDLLNELEQALKVELSRHPEGEDSLTYVPGEDVYIPEVIPSIKSNSGLTNSISSTPGISDDNQSDPKNSLNSPDVKSSSEYRIKANTLIHPKKHRSNKVGLLITLFLILIIGAGAFAAYKGYFGPMPFLDNLLAVNPVTTPLHSTATPGPNLVTPTITMAQLIKLYENQLVGVSLNIPENWTYQDNFDINGFGNVTFTSETNFDLSNLPDDISLAYLYITDKTTIANAANITNDPATLVPVANGFIDQIKTIFGIEINLVGTITPYTIGFFPAASAEVKSVGNNFTGRGILTVILSDNRIIVFLGISQDGHWNDREILFGQILKSFKIKPAKPTITPTLHPSTTPTISIPTQQITLTLTPTTKAECDDINGAWSGWSTNSQGNRINWNVKIVQVGCYMDVFFTAPYNTRGVGLVTGKIVTINTIFEKVPKTFTFLINRNLLEGYEEGDKGSHAYLNR